MHIQTRARIWLACGTALGGALSAPPANAQQMAFADPVAAPAMPAATGAESEPAGEAGGADQADDIVVTATRRETNLQETPIAISVINSEGLNDRHVQSLLDLSDGGLPSLRIATFEARQSALTIGMRGIVPLDANQPAREQGVGVYIDGVYLGRQHGLNAALLDVERVEVLRGPQGTLFGRNTEGGALNLVTRAPRGEFGGRVSVGIGNFGSYAGELHVDLPAIANIAIKIDAVIQHQDATVGNPLPGTFGWNYYHRYGGRIAARWRPAENLTVDLAYDRGHDENTPFYSQLINYNPFGLTVQPTNTPAGSIPAGTIRPLPPVVQVRPDRVTMADIGVPQQPSVDKTEGVTANVRWHISDAAELRSISAWRRVSDDQWDNSGGAHRTPVFVPNGNFSRYSLSRLTQHQFSQEFQLVGSIPQLDYVAGLYYFEEEAEDAAATPNTNRWNADGTGYTILDPIPTIPGMRVLDRASRAFSRSYAAYGQVTWTPAGIEQLHLTVGGRYTIDRKHGVLFRVNNAATNLTFEENSERFDPMVTIAWDLTERVKVYGRYATGYRAGGASSRSLIYRSFGPETVDSYELGLKTELFDRRVRFNVAAYAMDRTGSQIDFNFFDPITNRNTLETVNAPGVTRIRGIEAELNVRPMRGLSFALNYAYTHARIPSTANPLLPGNPIQPVFIVFTPPHAASGSVDYEMPVGDNGASLRFHLDANYSDRHHSFDNEDVLVDDSLLFNGRISLADIPVGAGGTTMMLSLWARNLFDEQHIYRRSNANGRVLGDYANFNAPRTFGLEAALRF